MNAFRTMLCLCLIGASMATAADEGQLDAASEELTIFSGQPRLIIVTGYSTSFHWWAFFQRKIDRHAAGERVIEVRPATKGGAPVARWIDVRTGEPLAPWTQIIRPALRRKGGRPAIVLAQQSLQWAFGERSAGITGEDDAERIARGADALQKYVELLLKDGADVVLLAMHIYKRPMEPRIGNERLALAELMTRTIPRLHAGPDVWEPTRQQYPGAFAQDKLHPNSIGAEIMAQMWFETLLKHDALEVPEWSRQEMAEAIKNDPVELRRGGLQRLLRQWGIADPRAR